MPKNFITLTPYNDLNMFISEITVPNKLFNIYMVCLLKNAEFMSAF